jgi:hypothetical protein
MTYRNPKPQAEQRESEKPRRYAKDKTISPREYNKDKSKYTLQTLPRWGNPQGERENHSLLGVFQS